MSGGGAQDGDRLLGLISGVYEAAGDPARWPDALGAVSRAVGAQVLNLFVLDVEQGRVPLSVSVGLPQDRVAEYNEHVMPHDPRVAFARANPQLGVYYDHLHTSEAEMARHAYYDWLGEEGLRYYVAVAAPLEGRLHGFVTAQRTARQGHAGPGDVELLRTLRPHLMRAMGLSLKLGELEARAQSGVEAAEASPFGVVVLDEQGGLLHLNREAQRIVAQGGVLRAARAGLSAVRASDDAALQRLISGALGLALGASAGAGGAMRLGRPDSPLGYVVQVVPLVGERPLFALARPAALVVVADPARRLPPLAAPLRALWGLTMREARLALLLGEGLSVKEAAVRMGIAEPTARAHLHAVFRKTDTTRQAELIRLLLTVAHAGGVPSGDFT